MEQKKYTCTTCNKGFENAYQLGGHKGSHARYDGMVIAKRIPHLCQQCGNTIKTDDIRKDRARKFCSNECRWIDHRNRWDKTLVFNVEKSKLRTYQAKIEFCEICGKKEVARTGLGQVKENKLCRDHNHNTGNFRGMLCYSCNVKLGWYEKYGAQINKYLNENDQFENVLKKMES